MRDEIIKYGFNNINTIAANADSADIVFLIFRYITIIRICESTILTCKKFI